MRVLMLPDVACLSARAAEVVRRFVRDGGGLVASFETSLYDEKLERHPDFALSDVLHAHYVATHPVQLRSDNIFLTIDADHPIVNDPLIHQKQSTSWLGGQGPPPEKGNLALIASAVEVTPAAGGQVLMTYNVNQPELHASATRRLSRRRLAKDASCTSRPASTRRCSFIRTPTSDNF